MAKQNGTMSNGSADAGGIGNLSAAIVEFDGIKREVEALDAKLTGIKAQRAAALERGKALAPQIRELLSLGGRHPAAKSAHKKRRGAQGEIALKLLLEDGGPYSTVTFAEEFGGSVGAAYQVLRKLRDKGLLKQPKEGQWELTEAGKQAAQEIG